VCWCEDRSKKLDEGGEEDEGEEGEREWEGGYLNSSAKTSRLPKGGGKAGAGGKSGGLGGECERALLVDEVTTAAVAIRVPSA